MTTPITRRGWARLVPGLALFLTGRPAPPRTSEPIVWGGVRFAIEFHPAISAGPVASHSVRVHELGGPGEFRLVPIGGPDR